MVELSCSFRVFLEIKSRQTQTEYSVWRGRSAQVGLGYLSRRFQETGFDQRALLRDAGRFQGSRFSLWSRPASVPQNSRWKRGPRLERASTIHRTPHLKPATIHPSRPAHDATRLADDSETHRFYICVSHPPSPPQSLAAWLRLVLADESIQSVRALQDGPLPHSPSPTLYPSRPNPTHNLILSAVVHK